MQDNLTKETEKIEFEQNKSSDSPKEDEAVKPSSIDNLQSDSEGGKDTGGTTERKEFGDTELNKGLEAQAKDEES